MGAPVGYAVLNYAGAPNSTLPATPTPQPGSVAAWTLEQVNGVRAPVLGNLVLLAPRRS